ncbi:MAG: carotenoid oxygenase family protein [Myxococcota bacterium]
MGFSRRNLLSGLGAAGLAAVCPRVAAAERHRAERCFERFNRAVSSNPGLDPWRSVNVSKLEPLRMTLEGSIPKGLRGTLYRNGPAGFERDGARYQHWFDGDGMVQAFRFDDGSIIHRGQKVMTEKWHREEEAGRFLVDGAGSSVPNAGPSHGNDGANPANVAVVPWGDDLLALWEAGSPYALDPDTLATKRRVVWSEDTDGMSFSAHPLIESDGRMWNFGLAQWVGKTGFMALYALSPTQGLERVKLLELPFAGYMHSFAMSERWLVFYLAPQVFDHSRGTGYVSAQAWEPGRGGRVLLVDKNDFDNHRWVDAPAGWIWHCGDARDLPGGGISMRAAWSDNPKTMSEGMYGVMCGEQSDLNSDSKLVTLTIKAGRASIERTEMPGEFPIVDPRGASAFLVMANDFELQMLDAKGKLRRLTAPGRVRLEEHRFVPRSARLGDGWLVGTGYDLAARASVVTVFDTQSRADGPVLVGRMNRRIPFGFHGWFARRG